MMASRNLKLRLEDMLQVTPLTPHQKQAYEAYEDGNSLVLSGSAGTGKTFMALSMALEDVLDKEMRYDKVVIIRSIVPTRDIGFLPGDEEEKKDAYTGPYRSICAELFNDSDAWMKLKNTGTVNFMSTSFIRGLTISNAVVVLDEMQNLTFHELDSIITRVGDNCRFIMCGDYYQTDLIKEREKNGIIDFMRILQSMPSVDIIEFGVEDIVRSGLCKEYLVAKEELKAQLEI